MLKLCEKAEDLAFLSSDPFCAKITAFAGTYGFDLPFARFYTADRNAAMSVIDGAVTLYCGTGTDYEEIGCFLSFTGFSGIQANAGVLDSLGIEKKKSSYIVKYSASPAALPEGFTDFFDAKEVYPLLKEGGFEPGTFPDFCESICARLGKGAARFGGIKRDGRLDACAFRLFEGAKSVLLGAVTTRAECRGEGLASSLVPYMAHPEKDTFLFCREDSLLEFYKNCGFALWGKWAENNEVTL